MGGKVLEFSADKYYNAGEAAGEARGEARGIAIGEARGEEKGVDYTMDVISNLVLSGNYEELIRMANDREYSKRKVQILKEG